MSESLNSSVAPHTGQILADNSADIQLEGDVNDDGPVSGAKGWAARRTAG